jgi:hypothetical protein
MPSTLQVDTIKDGSASNTLVEQSGSDWVWGSGLPSGSIIQTVSDTDEPSAQNITTTADDVLGSALEVDITASSTDNKLLIQCFIPNCYNYGVSGAYFNSGFRYDADFSSGNGTQLGADEFIGVGELTLASTTNLLMNHSYFTTTLVPVITPITIRPWFQSTGGSIRIGGGGIACLTVSEIKA